jgi:SAM-dependent methyltransferase
VNVADYYDKNTHRFLRFGRLGGLGVVHRGVWAPEATDPAEAAHYVHDRIAADVNVSLPKSPRGLDLGCGVGASMVRIARRTGASISGVTISSTQAAIAEERLSELPQDLVGRLSVRAGDFCAPEFYEGIPEKSLDFAYFIESLVHAPDPEALFRLLTSRFKPGARVYVCDDLLGMPRDSFSTVRMGRQSGDRIVENYRKGWHINTLVTPEELESFLTGFGLYAIESRDLTPYLKLNRLRDRLIRLAVPLFRPFGRNKSWWENFLGGDALQRALTVGLINYRLEIFEYRP